MNATSAQNAAQRSAGATFDVQSAADDTGLADARSSRAV